MRHGAAELEINFAILQLCNSHFFSHQTSTLLEWKWHNELILLHNIFMSHKNQISFEKWYSCGCYMQRFCLIKSPSRICHPCCNTLENRPRSFKIKTNR